MGAKSFPWKCCWVMAALQICAACLVVVPPTWASCLELRVKMVNMMQDASSSRSVPGAEATAAEWDKEP